MNRKGDITDLIVFIVMIFVLAIGFFVIVFIIPQITGGLRTAGLNNTDEGANALTQLDAFGSQGIQRGFVFVFAFMCIGLLISAYFINSHPLWIFLYILFLGVSIILAVYLSNAYNTLITNDAFASIVASQNLMNFILDNIIAIMVVVGGISLIVIFGKYRQKTAQRRL